MIFYKNLTPTVYTSVKNSGVLLTIRYLCEPRHRRASEHAIWEDILIAFNNTEGIDLAYPTQRIYYENLKDFSIKSSEKLADMDEKTNKGEQNDNA